MYGCHRQPECPHPAVWRLLLPVCLLFVSGCSVVKDYGVQSVAVAPDNGSFVVAYTSEDESLIAILDAEDHTPVVVQSSEAEFQYERPVFSADGERVFFIRRSDRDRSDIYVVDIDGSNLSAVTSGQAGAENIQDIALSADGETVYFINSGFFGHYSPIAASAPHEMDFYAVNRDGTGLQRLSWRNIYAFNGLSITPDEQELYSRAEILSLTEPGKFRPFTYSNPYRHAFTSRYPLSAISADGRILLSCAKVMRSLPEFSKEEKLELGGGWAVYGFGLYLIDTNEQALVDEIVFLRAYLDSPARFLGEERVLFIRNDSIYGGEAGRELWSVNFDGSGLHKIELPFDSDAD